MMQEGDMLSSSKNVKVTAKEQLSRPLYYHNRHLLKLLGQLMAFLTFHLIKTPSYKLLTLHLIKTHGFAYPALKS
jgi:hypothetical protein